MGDTGTLIANLIGACLPGILLYAIVQRWIRRRPTTALGFVVVMGISVVIATSGILKDRRRTAAIESQTLALASLESGCRKLDLPSADCTYIARCVLTRMEARYSTDEAWLAFARRIQANEAGIPDYVMGLSEVCSLELQRRNRM